jgi:hypothetical protein
MQENVRTPACASALACSTRSCVAHASAAALSALSLGLRPVRRSWTDESVLSRLEASSTAACWYEARDLTAVLGAHEMSPGSAVRAKLLARVCAVRMVRCIHWRVGVSVAREARHDSLDDARRLFRFSAKRALGACCVVRSCSLATSFSTSGRCSASSGRLRRRSRQPTELLSMCSRVLRPACRHAGSHAGQTISRSARRRTRRARSSPPPSLRGSPPAPPPHPTRVLAGRRWPLGGCCAQALPSRARRIPAAATGDHRRGVTRRSPCWVVEERTAAGASEVCGQRSVAHGPSVHAGRTVARTLIRRPMDLDGIASAPLHCIAPAVA